MFGERLTISPLGVAINLFLDTERLTISPCFFQALEKEKQVKHSEPVAPPVAQEWKRFFPNRN